MFPGKYIDPTVESSSLSSDAQLTTIPTILDDEVKKKFSYDQVIQLWLQCISISDCKTFNHLLDGA